MTDRAPFAPAQGGNNTHAERGRLRSLFTPWKGSGGGGAAAAGGFQAEEEEQRAPPPPPVVLRSWQQQRDRQAPAPPPPPPEPPITLTLAQQHVLSGGRGRALAFDLPSGGGGGSPALYAGDGPASLKKLSLLSPHAPLALRLPAASRGLRAVAPPAHRGCGGLVGVATAGAGLVMVSGQTGNAVATVPFSGPAPGTSAGAWSVAWSPLRPAHELLVGLDGGRVATVDLRCAASSLSSSGGAGARAVLSVVRMGDGGGDGSSGAGASFSSSSSSSTSSSSSSTIVGPPVHTLVPLPPGCEAALVGGEALAASAAGVFALWRPPGLALRPLAAPRLTPALPRGASCESASVSADGGAVAVSVRRRAGAAAVVGDNHHHHQGGGGGDGGGGGAEVWVFGLAGDGDEDEDDDEDEDEEEDEQRRRLGQEQGEEKGKTRWRDAVPLRLGGHVSAAHMTAGALLPLGGGLVYASGDEARRAVVAWRVPARRRAAAAAALPAAAQPLPLPPSLSPASLPAPLPSPVLAVTGALLPGLLAAGGSAGGNHHHHLPPLLLAAASAGCVRIYQAAAATG